MPFDIGTTNNSVIDRLSQDRVHHFATLWRITRTDGVVYRFTDHNSSIIWLTETFSPQGGLESSAKQFLAELKQNNLNLKGIVSSDDISEDDLRAGLFWDAAVEEYLVDWKHPPPITAPYWYHKYWIIETSWNGYVWEAVMGGQTRRLRHKVGRIISRNCSWTLGDSRCTFNIGSLTLTARKVDSVDSTSKRRIFTSAGASPVTGVGSDGYFDFGLITWTVGTNDGLKGECKFYTEAPGKIEMQLDMSFDIDINDEFTIYPGCDKTVTDCKTKFTNFVNYGGFPTVPGQDKVFVTPNAK